MKNIFCCHNLIRKKMRTLLPLVMVLAILLSMPSVILPVQAATNLTLEKQVSISPLGPWTDTLTGVTPGELVFYQFTLTNSGDAVLSGLSIIDPEFDTSVCVLTDPLAPGAVTSCVLGPFVTGFGLHTNVAIAQATTPEIDSPPNEATYITGSYDIEGTVWEDEDADGLIDFFEVGLTNVTLELYLDNGNGILDPADTFLGTTQTDEDGNYSFTFLPPGIYFVQVTDGVEGYTHVSGGSNPRQIILTDGDSVDNNFGYRILEADLLVTKTDGVTSVDSGTSTTYTVRVTNLGPDPVNGATLVDIAGVGLSPTAVVCSPAPSNQCATPPVLADLLSTGVTLPDLAPDQFYELLLTATVTATSGTVTNTATTAPPTGTIDPNLTNNTAFDTDLVIPPPPEVDLQVTKTDGVDEVISGSSTTYTVRVTNLGPDPVNSATLVDIAGVGLSPTAAVCSPAPSNQCATPPVLADLLSTGVTLPDLAPNQFYELLLTATVTATSGTVTNTATTAPPTGTIDTNLTNNTASDTDLVIPPPPEVDLQVTKTDGVTSVDSGAATTYTVRVTNLGPDPVNGATLVDIAGVGLSPTAAVCSPALSNQCATPPVLADLLSTGVTLPDLAPNQFYELLLTATVTATSGTVTNTATTNPPTGTVDTDLTNNTASDTDLVIPPPPEVDLLVTKTDGVISVNVNSSTTYTVRVTNLGPDPVNGATLVDIAGVGLSPTAAVCSPALSNQCATPPVLADLLSTGVTLPDLAPNQFYELLLTATVTATSGTVTNSATTAPPTGTVDTDLTNNTASDTDTVELYRLWLPLVLSQETEVAIEWSSLIGYEDLSLVFGLNDFDYNDWAVAIDGSFTYQSISANLLKEFSLSFSPRTRGGTYDHSFQVRFPAGTFASNGTVTYELFDGNRNLISKQVVPFYQSMDNTFMIFARTTDVFPTSVVNTIEGGDSQPAQRYANLTVTFDSLVFFDNDPSKLSDPHGGGLFFDPELFVFKNSEYIHQGDTRLLSIPTSTWLWPEEGIRIDQAYPLVVYKSGTPPDFTFPNQWWMVRNNCVYNGITCGVP